ncbi:MAG: HIT family protein, partial [Simkaniaceae bacterium]|nr:HIT family protein [Simkaniaceae bacterium]
MAQINFQGPMPLPGSFHIVNDDRKFPEHTEQDHHETYAIMQKAAQNHDQFFVHGRVKANEKFQWTFIPYEKCESWVTRIWQQLKVLMALTFGGSAETLQVNQDANFTEPTGGTCKSDDAFCRTDVITKQLVFEGTDVNLLFNYAPIGNSHFLIVPKQHRSTFHALTKAEYTESAQIAQKIANVYADQTIYMNHKSGKDAGQSVPHWHMHVIVLDNVSDELTGRLHVLWKMLMPVFPLSKEALAKRIA